MPKGDLRPPPGRRSPRGHKPELRLEEGQTSGAQPECEQPHWLGKGAWAEPSLFGLFNIHF